MPMTAVNRYSTSPGKWPSPGKRRRQRAIALYANWASWRADRCLLLANRAVQRCHAVIQAETIAWAAGDLPLHHLLPRLEQRLSAVVQTTIGRPLPVQLVLPGPAHGQRDTTAGPELAELCRTARTLHVIQWAAGRAWAPVEGALPGHLLLRYDLGKHALAAAGVNVRAERQRVQRDVAACRYGQRLDLAVRLQRLFLRQAAHGLYAWSDAARPGKVITEQETSACVPAVRYA